MRKLLLGFICGLVAVGVANVGHAVDFFGGHKRPSAGSSLDVGSLLNFNQFSVDLKSGDFDPTQFDYFKSFPDLDSNQDDAGPIIPLNSHLIHRGNGALAFIVPDTGPVSHPARIILMGSALIGLSFCGKKKFFK